MENSLNQKREDTKNIHFAMSATRQGIQKNSNRPDYVSFIQVFCADKDCIIAYFFLGEALFVEYEV